MSSARWHFAGPFGGSTPSVGHDDLKKAMEETTQALDAMSGLGIPPVVVSRPQGRHSGHPTVPFPCKFGSSCYNPNCAYLHPGEVCPELPIGRGRGRGRGKGPGPVSYTHLRAHETDS